MADRSFEIRLERLFAEAPPMADRDLFEIRALERLDRGWNLRRTLIGGLGVAGGLIGGAQVLSSGVMGRIMAEADRSDQFVDHAVSTLRVSGFSAAGLPVDMQVLWMSGVLGLVAIGLLLARAVREI